MVVEFTHGLEGVEISAREAVSYSLFQLQNFIHLRLALENATLWLVGIVRLSF